MPIQYDYEKLTASSDREPDCASCDITNCGLSLSESAAWAAPKKEVGVDSDSYLNQWPAGNETCLNCDRVPSQSNTTRHLDCFKQRHGPFSQTLVDRTENISLLVYNLAI